MNNLSLTTQTMLRILHIAESRRGRGFASRSLCLNPVVAEICDVIIFISEFLNCETILNLEITCHDYS